MKNKEKINWIFGISFAVLSCIVDSEGLLALNLLCFNTIILVINNLDEIM